MSVMLFNSRDKMYKSNYGAVASESKTVFRLLLPCDVQNDVKTAKLVVLNDTTSETKAFNLYPVDRYIDSNRFWEVTYTAEAPGLYWYYFEYEDLAGNINKIFRGRYATGHVSDEDVRWQLTVFENVYTPSSDFKGGIMYQIFPDRFYFSGEKKDNIPYDRILKDWGTQPDWKPDPKRNIWNNDYMCGDLKGIEEKLSYLKAMNVTTIYINPIFEAHSNHRYNTANYLKIDPLLGTEEDFVSLCNEAHKRGMKIILDGVFSHTGDDSIYFNKYKRYDNLGAYNSKESPYFSWYKFQEWPDKYTSWWGIDILPEVIEETPEYLEFITGSGGIIEKWLRLGADGWRLDVADELPDEFIEAIRTRIEAVKPSALLLGEVWEDASNKTAYDIRRKYLLGRELKSVMNYPFKEAIIGFLAYDDADNFMDNILTITENYPKDIVDNLMNPLGTHDTMRIITRLSGENCEGKDREWQSKFSLTDEQRLRCINLFEIAVAIQYTLPGFPSVYYGDEVGMEGCKDPFNRQCYPWDSENINEELLSLHIQLGKLRSHFTLLRDADFIPISGALGCIAYSREYRDNRNNDALVVVANRTNQIVYYKLPWAYNKSTLILTNASNGACRYDGVGNLTLAPESFAILTCKKKGN